MRGASGTLKGKNMRITAKHPARRELCDLPNYFETKGDALSAIRDTLERHGLRADCPGLEGKSGWVTCAIFPDNPACVVCENCGKHTDSDVFDNLLVLSWYTMENSGRVELTVYIS